MRLIIAEKPSLGRAIADALPQRFSADGRGDKGSTGLRSECGTVVVTWAFGHILELSQPQAYDPAYKRWRYEDLPIVVPNGEWRYEEKVPAQIKAIAGYLKNAREVIHAGDPDREGQLLIDEILVYLGYRGKVMRLLPHATDPESLRKAWAKLEDNARYRPLYEAALCRQRADWLVGMNGSRAATLRSAENGQAINVGRVMTPTLALVVRRDQEIEAFKAKTFYKVAAICRTEDGQEIELICDPSARIFERARAQALADSVKGKRVQLAVSSVKTVERAPLPWHLGDFQRSIQKMLGLGLGASLQLLQDLYEARLVSYPRTSCRYLPREQMPDALPILDALMDAVLTEQMPAGGMTQAKALRAVRNLCAPKDYIYDSAKVAEHHGIVPTKVGAKALPQKREHLIAYQAIVRHFARTLLPHHESMQSAIGFEHEGASFALKGQRSLNWERSHRMFEVRRDALLPEVRHGSTAQVVEVRLVEGKTTPPARYTQSTLASDMEAIAKFVTDERVAARLKESSGIGTAATRSAIIEKLIAKGMLQEKRAAASRSTKKDESDEGGDPVASKEGGKAPPRAAELHSTDFGREIVAAMPRTLVDPGITAAWEDALDEIAQGRYDAVQFMDRVGAMVGRLVQGMGAADAARVRAMPPAAAQPSTSKTSTTGTRSAPKAFAPRRTAPSRASGAGARASFARKN